MPHGRVPPSSCHRLLAAGYGCAREDSGSHRPWVQAGGCTFGGFSGGLILAEGFRRSIRADTSPGENAPVVLQQDDLEIRTEALVGNAERPLEFLQQFPFLRLGPAVG